MISLKIFPPMLLFVILSGCYPGPGIATTAEVGLTIEMSESSPLPSGSPAALTECPSSTPTRVDTKTPTETEANPTPDWAEKSHRVDERFTSLVTGHSPGGAVIVIQDGKILHEAGYGFANLAADAPITTSSIFHLASVGKQFTAISILMLRDRGKLNLDDPVVEYLPELAHFGEGVTIRRLLNHTSGIPDAYSGKLLDALKDRSPTPTNVDLLGVLSGTEALRFTPGDQFEYSNTGYDVLGALIERVSGQPYPDFLEENIFRPLGMENSFSLPSLRQKTDPLLVHSYVKYQGTVQAYDYFWLDDIVGSGTVYSSVVDMYSYDQALYTDALLAQSTLTELFQPAVLNDGTESPYGFGWKLKMEGGERSYAHGGKWLGYQVYYERFPDRRLSIIVLMNWNYGPAVEDVETSIREIYLH
jgi:CubicO group peptidase (beta-lactamase class C family)